MGMAASQARLLTITARIHDVEYQAQSIQSAKVQLATQSDQVYQDYLAALDATTLTVKDYEGNVITANFNNLCGPDAVLTGQQYALRTSSNQLIVSDEIKEEYDDFMEDIGTNDPYAFALYVMNKESIGNPEGGSESEFMENLSASIDSVYESHKGENTTLDNLKKSLDDMGDYSDLSADDKKKYKETLSSFKYQLYKSYGAEIYNKSTDQNDGSSDFDQSDFDYYVQIFKEIQAAGGGCVSIADYNGIDGLHGDAANDSDWLQNMIKCGKITLEVVNTDKKTGEVSLSTTAPDSDTYVDYTTTTTIDKKALAKAEAEYEHATKEIDRKDKKFDMDLSKLETERTALTTEYDSVKKVISDNIERTFGIFS